MKNYFSFEILLNMLDLVCKSPYTKELSEYIYESINFTKMLLKTFKYLIINKLLKYNEIFQNKFS